jgi:hypothetical protein
MQHNMADRAKRMGLSASILALDCCTNGMVHWMLTILERRHACMQVEAVLFGSNHGISGGSNFQRKSMQELSFGVFLPMV